VYFAVDDYSDLDFIIANEYLSYIFAEHVVVTGIQDYAGYSRLCSKNLQQALSRLPLLLPASMEAIAALMLGVHNLLTDTDLRPWLILTAVIQCN
jgi:hypothetical protein